MLKFICDICQKEYDADISKDGIRYLDNNVFEIIRQSSDPCGDCAKIIKEAEETAKQRIIEQRNQPPESETNEPTID